MVDNRTFRAHWAPGHPANAAHACRSPPDGYLPHHRRDAYRIAGGGAAVQLTDCAPLGGCPGAVPVDAGTIAGLGGGRLLATPKDGTVLRGLPSKRTWEIVGGKRRETFIARLDAVDVDDGAIGLIPAEGPGPAPPAPEVFKPVISSGYKVFRRYTRFTSLKVRDALPGSVVTVSCAGKRKGCPFKKAKQHRLNGHVPERLQPLVQEGQAQEQEHGDGARHEPRRRAQAAGVQDPLAQAPGPHDAVRRGRSEVQPLLLMCSSSWRACAAPSRNAHASSICSRSPTMPKSTRFL